MTNLTTRERARALLEEELGTSNRIKIADTVAKAKDADVGRSTLYRTAREMGLRTLLEGPRGGWWERAT